MSQESERDTVGPSPTPSLATSTRPSRQHRLPTKLEDYHLGTPDETDSPTTGSVESHLPQTAESTTAPDLGLTTSPSSRSPPRLPLPRVAATPPPMENAGSREGSHRSHRSARSSVRSMLYAKLLQRLFDGEEQQRQDALIREERLRQEASAREERLERQARATAEAFERVAAQNLELARLALSRQPEPSPPGQMSRRPSRASSPDGSGRSREEPQTPRPKSQSPYYANEELRLKRNDTPLDKPGVNGRPYINGESEDEEKEEEVVRVGSGSPRASPSAPPAPGPLSPQTEGQERLDAGLGSPGGHSGSEDEEEKEETAANGGKKSGRSVSPTPPHAETKVKRGEEEEEKEEDEKDRSTESPVPVCVPPAQRRPSSYEEDEEEGGSPGAVLSPEEEKKRALSFDYTEPSPSLLPPTGLGVPDTPPKSRSPDSPRADPGSLFPPTAVRDSPSSPTAVGDLRQETEEPPHTQTQDEEEESDEGTPSAPPRMEFEEKEESEKSELETPEKTTPIQKKLIQTEDTKLDVEQQRDTLKNQKVGLEREPEATKKRMEVYKKDQDELVRDRDMTEELKRKPLGYASSNPVITPNSLLMGRPDTALPLAAYASTDEASDRTWKWRHRWDRGKDGRVRSAIVDTGQRTYHRPVARLIELPPHADQTPPYEPPTR